MTAAVFSFDRITDKRHVISLIDGPNMSNLGHRSKNVYGATDCPKEDAVLIGTET